MHVHSAGAGEKGAYDFTYGTKKNLSVKSSIYGDVVVVVVVPGKVSTIFSRWKIWPYIYIYPYVACTVPAGQGEWSNEPRTDSGYSIVTDRRWQVYGLLHKSTKLVFSSVGKSVAYHHHQLPVDPYTFRQRRGHRSRGQNSCRREIAACCETIRHKSPLHCCGSVQRCQSWIHYSVSICWLDVFTTVIITAISISQPTAFVADFS